MRTSREWGLTLVEVLVSILIVGAAAAALASAFSTGLMALRATRETTLVLNAAQQEIEKMRNSSFDTIATHSFSVPALNTNGSLVRETAGTDLIKVSVNVAWVSGGRRNMSISLVTYIAKGGINRR